MNSTLKWLDDYMEDKLSPQQQLDFEAAMERDEKIETRSGKLPPAQNFLPPLIEDETRQMLKDLDNKQAMPDNSRRLWWWLAAAVFVGLDGIHRQHPIIRISRQQTTFRRPLP